MTRKWLQITGGVIGAGIILAMLSANQLGLDKDPVWGAKRYLLFLIGLFIFAVSLFYRKDNFLGQAFHTSAGRFYLAAATLSGFIIIVYIWFVSTGLWISWPNETSYYDLLATAFSHGQLAVDLQPDPALLTMENVYEPGNREGIPVLWDASLYNGKYYLYWGPLPLENQAEEPRTPPPTQGPLKTKGRQPSTRTTLQIYRTTSQFRSNWKSTPMNPASN